MPCFVLLPPPPLRSCDRVRSDGCTRLQGEQASVTHSTIPKIRCSNSINVRPYAIRYGRARFGILGIVAPDMNFYAGMSGRGWGARLLRVLMHGWAVTVHCERKRGVIFGYINNLDPKLHTVGAEGNVDARYGCPTTLRHPHPRTRPRGPAYGPPKHVTHMFAPLRKSF